MYVGWVTKNIFFVYTEHWSLITEPMREEAPTFSIFYIQVW